jgi:ABC-type transport system involved in multi-copper enzyme maturation permease subunit
MKRLLSIELQKIVKNKASRLLTVIYFLLLTSIALLISQNFFIFGNKFKLGDLGIFNFPFIWHATTWFAAWFKLFLSIVVVSMIANEYSYGTLKQNLIDGLSKKEFILTKFITITLFSAISTLFVFITSLILGLCFSAYNEIGIICTDLIYFLAYFLKLVCFFSFCIFVALLVRRSAFALGFLFLWWIVEWIIQLQFLRRIFSDPNTADHIANLMPFGAMGVLIKEPITRFHAYQALEHQLTQNVTVRDYSVHWYEILVVLAWIAIFIIASYKLLQKRDL